MSALGQEQTFGDRALKPALPLKADIRRYVRRACLVPEGDMQEDQCSTSGEAPKSNQSIADGNIEWRMGFRAEGGLQAIIVHPDRHVPKVLHF
jgi:hypothetical protein